MKCKNKIEMLDNMKNSISVFFPEGVIKSNNINNWKFKTTKFHVSTYTGIPIFEFSFSITLQNISVEVESTVAIVNHSLQKEILHMGKVFVLRSKYKSKLSFCTKKGPNYGHVLKVQKKNSHKKVNSGIRLYMIRILDLLDFVYLCVSASANNQHKFLNLQLFKKISWSWQKN